MIKHNLFLSLDNWHIDTNFNGISERSGHYLIRNNSAKDYKYNTFSVLDTSCVCLVRVIVRSKGYAEKCLLSGRAQFVGKLICKDKCLQTKHIVYSIRFSVS